MDYQNLTPFPSLAFDSIDVKGGEFHAAVLRMTLQVEPDGRLSPAQEPSPLMFQDTFFGEPFKSSVYQESDLAPYKPWCDVIVVGNARAPGQKPMKRFEAGIRIMRKGDLLLTKQLLINGPRCWENRFARGWTLTQPEPILSLPLRYEYAYGGECRLEANDSAARKIKKAFKLSQDQRELHPDGPDKAPLAHSCADANPIGQGFIAPWYLKSKAIKRLPAPQIESMLDPIKKFGKTYAPQGLGAIGRAWSPRRELSGTIDAAFVKSGRSLPEDFDFAYWNGAHPDLQVPWLLGNETIDLINIPIADLPSNRIDSQGNRITRLQLPGQSIAGLARFKNDHLAFVRFNIDTLLIEAPYKKVTLTYRAKISSMLDVQSFQVELLSPEARGILASHVDEVNAAYDKYEVNVL